tara:strand:+ start:327 stop:527 length:201 start_codon:yes stop_codon:yes gene_type:complete
MNTIGTKKVKELAKHLNIFNTHKVEDNDLKVWELLGVSKEIDYVVYTYVNHITNEYKKVKYTEKID